MSAPLVSGVRVPAQLRQQQIFCCWRLVEAHPKPKKMPYYANGIIRHGKQGSVNDRANLVTFMEARAAAAKLNMDGIGMVLLPELGIVVIDFDDCIDADGNMPAEVARIALRGHTEFSLSGTGLHTTLEGTLGDLRDHPEGTYGVDILATNGFIALTGDQLKGSLDYEQPLAGVDDFTRTFCEGRGARQPRVFDPNDFMAGHQPALNISYAEIVDTLCKLDPSMSYPSWIQIGMALSHQFHRGPPEGMSPDDGFDLWNEWSSCSSEYPKADGYAILRNFWDRFDLEHPHPTRFATAIAMAKNADTDPQVQATLRSALAPPEAPKAGPTPEEVFGRPKPLLQMGDAPGALQSPPGFTGRFPVTSVLASIAMPPMDWHVRPLVPFAELGMIYGPSGVGKSFLCIDLMCCIAMGMSWHGFAVRQEKVLYVVAEGNRAFGHRLRAWCEHHGVDPRELAKNLAVINDAPNLGEAEQAAAVITAILSIGGVGIVAFDTWARVTAGKDENSALDMGLAINHVQSIHKATGATMLVLHHPGKDVSLGARGSSAIKAALDFELCLLPVPFTDDLRVLTVTKMKDGEASMRYGLMLDRVVLAPRDNDAVDEETGEVIPLTSRVVRLVDMPSDPMSSVALVLTEDERFVVDTLDTLPVDKFNYTFETLVAAIAAAAPPPLRDANGVDLERDQRYFRYGIAVDGLLKKRTRIRRQGSIIVIS